MRLRASVVLIAAGSLIGCGRAGTGPVQSFLTLYSAPYTDEFVVGP